MGSIMLACGGRVVTRAATVGYTAGRHRRPAATAPVADATLDDWRRSLPEVLLNGAMAVEPSTNELRFQIEQDKLAELIDEYTCTEAGFAAEELAAARTALYGTEGSDADRS
jgi:hypothetical protein